MANEINVAFNMSVVNGFFSETIQPGSVQIDQSGIGRSGVVQTIGIVEEVVDFDELTTEGVMYMRNLDETNFVQFGPEDGGVMDIFCKLKAGEYALMRVAPSVIVRAKADTAPVKLDVRIYED